MSQQHADYPLDPSGPERRPEPRTERPRWRALPRYNLILHGNAHEMMHVVRTIMQLTRFCVAEATHKMWEAHHLGRSLLLVTYKERGELYVEQFAERGLTVTIEPL